MMRFCGRRRANCGDDARLASGTMLVARRALRRSPRAVMVARAIASRRSVDVFAMIYTVRRTRSVADDDF